MLNPNLFNIPKIIIALDFCNKKSAMKIVNLLNPSIYYLKIGKEMFTVLGCQFIKELHQLGFNIFLDLKFHDIPNTVFNATKAAADLGIWMLSVHASGGKKMLVSAKKALKSFKTAPLLIAITALTSLKEEELKEIGIQMSLKEYILTLSKLSNDCGLDGIVCPGKEAKKIKSLFGDKCKIVTPGIRVAEDALYDQNNIITPKEAKKYKIDYIVIGRSITMSKDPIKKLELIIKSMQ
ncbi:orotidine-5'-phosphate decarboxylase [Buchnera aphidicola]|uniref:Orotidine 5'-phosphate decarboxylase n=1 Tax=Buchnera aphidicola str. USDA (Myzus persicae) TaxID=1009856 RepID=W0P020_BUCMP|nr:orotidine-5'-phosphate decarboxylase [Buchnera aphidicola]AHG60111.1 Pyrf [Buchnera aphidicola str. USDA (Myzus persicae)]AHG60691.1 Pyrf [Buchnera aphidicola str. W106 (Myzus persicae)]AHG61263.1 Pyrf [Buchnera aphidicola str. G002 (Myzus persicae)]AHG61836.1 Pyrf [Buchnera aphidicola str. F009 (Myzus persicae)]WAI03200.1 MAG: orotidine-5'-phosphate decarboxylase [Buchnera aphidicola (Myzus persicae)]